MNIGLTVPPSKLSEILWTVALARPVFIWGPPGIGKSTLVENFAAEAGLPCVSLLGSQLAPEDIIGVPRINGSVSEFCPPKMIARDEPYCLFLDELNACSHEVQKAFYSLINDRRVGEYKLPPGSVVLGAGNRSNDSAIVRTMSSALINRMLHVELRVSHREWLEWAAKNDVHELVYEYVQNRPDHLLAPPDKTEVPFSTPRSWHILSDCLRQYAAAGSDPALDPETAGVLARGCLSAHHAAQFVAFIKQAKNKYKIAAIISGEEKWPSRVEDRDVLYFLAQSYRARLAKELPEKKENLSPEMKETAHLAKAALKNLAAISLEIAQMAVSKSDQENEPDLPDWFVVEIIRDLPRLAAAKE
ncbi:MAG: MoxR family ATPase [Deltaproteobacteria bacterium]|jgi:MoxR-like ATPase|nr:MoxR family ATPase [Deltaproteobacteria bacterium]